MRYEVEIVRSEVATVANSHNSEKWSQLCDMKSQLWDVNLLVWQSWNHKYEVVIMRCEVANVIKS